MTAIQLNTPLPEGKRAVLIIMDRVARLTNLQYFVGSGALRRCRDFAHAGGVAAGHGNRDECRVPTQSAQALCFLGGIMKKGQQK
jgi:hypothetical protein